MSFFLNLRFFLNLEENFTGKVTATENNANVHEEVVVISTLIGIENLKESENMMRTGKKI